MKEEWKFIKELNGYEVSNLGRVKSSDRVLVYYRGGLRIERSHRGKVLQPGTTASGHQLVVLGRNQNRYVHRLVLEAFIGLAPDGMECCHADGDPSNNALDNLRWGTRSENIADSIRHGTHRWQRAKVAS